LPLDLKEREKWAFTLKEAKWLRIMENGMQSIFETEEQVVKRQ
jgi:hypothetical protein